MRVYHYEITDSPWLRRVPWLQSIRCMSCLPWRLKGLRAPLDPPRTVISELGDMLCVAKDKMCRRGGETRAGRFPGAGGRPGNSSWVVGGGAPGVLPASSPCPVTRARGHLLPLRTHPVVGSALLRLRSLLSSQSMRMVSAAANGSQVTGWFVTV